MHRRWIEAALLVSLAMTMAPSRHDNPPASHNSRPPQLPPPGVGATRPEVGAAAFDRAGRAKFRARRSVRKPSRARGQKPPPAFEHDPDLDAQDQFAPSQVQQPLPDAVAMPSSGGQTHTRAAAHGSDAVVEPGAARDPRAQARPTSSPAAESSPRIQATRKLASAFQSRNVPTRRSTRIPAARRRQACSTPRIRNGAWKCGGRNPQARATLTSSSSTDNRTGSRPASFISG